jgi:hypothetical protein
VGIIDPQEVIGLIDVGNGRRLYVIALGKAGNLDKLYERFAANCYNFFVRGEEELSAEFDAHRCFLLLLSEDEILFEFICCFGNYFIAGCNE